jgi:dipeptidyl aminopeptidase/acylaminoacyl peptidase
MAAVQPIQYAARDGQTIHGYLTLPPGGPGTNLALIVMPHGGPNLRDFGEYDSQVQFLANRGYAVLQMNFRGSSGYGLKFMRAGFKEWGGKMQDDMTDGVNWAIAQGIADKSRIGVFGASYGGYAALMGLIKTPELFKCAISYAGVIDVDAFAQYVAKIEPFQHDFERIAQERIGDYRADKKHLEEISPAHLQDKIQAPILLAYGARDPKVDVEQARKLASGLSQKHKKFELIIEENEGHGFHRLSSRTNLYNRIERFLNENLGRSEPR